MNGSIQELNNIFGNSSDLSTETPDHRVEEFRQIIKSKDEIVKENQKSAVIAKRTFTALSGIFLASAGLLATDLLPIAGDSLATLGGFLLAFGIFFGSIFTARKVIPAPLERIKERAEEVMNNVLRKVPRSSAPRFVPPSRKKKMILGVGSFIAQKTDIAPEVVRTLLVILGLMSGGAVIPAYILFGFILNAIQKNERN